MILLGEDGDWNVYEHVYYGWGNLTVWMPHGHPIPPGRNSFDWLPKNWAVA